MSWSVDISYSIWLQWAQSIRALSPVFAADLAQTTTMAHRRAEAARGAGGENFSHDMPFVCKTDDFD
jgi:hypothetical protein